MRENPNIKTKKGENKMEYDIIAKSWKQEVVFEGNTEKGIDWIRRNWLAESFCTGNLLNASLHIKKMNSDGISVVLLCGV